MRIQHWIYATTEGCYDRQSVVDKMQTIAEILRDFDYEPKTFGWSAIPVVEEADYDDFDVDRDEVAPITGGKLPFLYLTLSFDLDKQSPDHPTLQKIITDYHLELALRYPDL